MDKKLSALLLIFFLSFGLFTTALVFNSQIKTATRAKEELIASSKDSLVFAWPLTVKNNEKSSISVFVRNIKGTPLGSKQVNVTTTKGKILEPTTNTDKEGKASFQLSSQGELGVADIEVTVDGNIKLTRTISVKFE